MHTYIMVYEWYSDDKNSSKIHDKLATYECHELINQTSWLIQSNKTAKEIYQDFIPLFPDRFLFITETILEHSAGYLWDQCCDNIKEMSQQPYLKELDIRK